MLSSGMKCYHLELMLSSGTKCFHLGLHVIIWDYMLSSGTICYYLGLHVIIWDAMLSSGANVIIWDKMLSSGANVIMVSSEANVIIWCYHVMLSSVMITHPFFYFSWKLHSLLLRVMQSLGYNIKNWGISTKKFTSLVQAEHPLVILWTAELEFLKSLWGLGTEGE